MRDFGMADSQADKDDLIYTELLMRRDPERSSLFYFEEDVVIIKVPLLFP